jgi:thiol-disulfide isomerase/thioredoxin
MQTVIKSVIAAMVFAACAAFVCGGEANIALAPHARELVVLQDDQLVPFDASKFLSAPVTILYFGAGWCPDCRKFSPKLVSSYNAQTGNKKFEVLFVSKDNTEQAMTRFMKGEKMPWPAVAFSKIAEAEDLNKYYSGKGIPCLTVIRGYKLPVEERAEQLIGFPFHWVEAGVVEHEFAHPQQSLAVIVQADAGLLRSQVHHHDPEVAVKSALLTPQRTGQLVAGPIHPLAQ